MSEKEQPEERKDEGVDIVITPATATRFCRWLFGHESPLGVVIFRIFWGYLIYYEAMRLFENDWQLLRFRLYSTAYHPPYPWTPEWMVVPHAIVAQSAVMLCFAAAAGVSLGFYYRLSMAYFAFFKTFYFLTDHAHYLNHGFLEMYVSWMLVALPLNACWSLDALFHPNDIRRSSFPRIIRHIIVINLTFVYLFGCKAKFNEAWLRGMPLGVWNRVKPQHRSAPLWVQELILEWWWCYALSYGGILWDGLAPLLFYLSEYMWHRSRGFLWRSAHVALLTGLWLGSAAFHGYNRWQWSIGIFPLMSMVTSTLYMPSSWPIDILRGIYYIVTFQWLRRVNQQQQQQQQQQQGPSTKLTWRQLIVLAFALLFIFVSIAYPLRSHFYGGDVAWDDAGHICSWRMKLRDRSCHPQFFTRTVVDYIARQQELEKVKRVTQQHIDRWTQEFCAWRNNVSDYVKRKEELPQELYVKVPRRQHDPRLVKNPHTMLPHMNERTMRKVAQRPWLLQHYARAVETELNASGLNCSLVTADVMCSLNDRPPWFLVDESVPLSDENLSTHPPDWVTPQGPIHGYYRMHYPWTWIPSRARLWWYGSNETGDPFDNNVCMPWQAKYSDANAAFECYRWWCKEGGREAYYERYPAAPFDWSDPLGSLMRPMSLVHYSWESALGYARTEQAHDKECSVVAIAEYRRMRTRRAAELIRQAEEEKQARANGTVPYRTDDDLV